MWKESGMTPWVRFDTKMEVYVVHVPLYPVPGFGPQTGLGQIFSANFYCCNGFYHKE